MSEKGWDYRYVDPQAEKILANVGNMFLEKAGDYHPEIESFIRKGLEFVEKFIVDSDSEYSGTGNLELNHLEDVQVAATVVSNQSHYFSGDFPDRLFLMPHVTVISENFRLRYTPRRYLIRVRLLYLASLDDASK